MHAMIDIETVGLGVTAPLFEIGVVLFDPKECKPLEELSLQVDLMDVMWRTGFCPQPETLDWWRKQEHDPTTVDAYERYKLVPALKELTEFLTKFKVEFVWANSPSFDLVILELHYMAVGLKEPWTHKQELDFRTALWLYGDVKKPANELPHCALSDAKHQVLILSEIMR